MGVIGISRESKKFLTNLDERKLIDLFADLLSLDGHKNIRITDGPDDGGRDIHSRDDHGNKYLTQSKYHSDLSNSISAKILGELVASMVRLDYKKGIFLTNAKISPAAKRDCLNSYPGYSIDFVDGRELVNRVFDNIVLKSIWYDGISIDKVNYALIIPVIGRDLENDTPFSVDLKNNLKFKFKVGHTKGQFRFQGSISSSSILFPAYRPPLENTFENFMSGKFFTSELVITGLVHLGDYDSILKKISEILIPLVRSNYDGMKHFALLFGIPFVAPLSGERSGGRFQLENFTSITIVNHGKHMESEKDWLLPTEKNEWVLPTFFQVSQMDYVRWFNLKNDVCLKLSVICSATENERWVIEHRNKFHLEGWKKSLFMIVSNNLVEKIKKDVVCKTPQIFPWSLESTLLVWPNPIFFNDGPDIFDDDDPDYFSQQDVEKILERIRAKIETYGGQLVDPMKARYMIAIVDSDPFPNTQDIEFRPVELAYETESVPTPILPKSRHIQFTVCWLITLFEEESHSLKIKIEKMVEKIPEIDNHYFKLELGYHNPEQYADDHYITCHFHYINPMSNEKTSTLIKNIEPDLISIVNNVELMIKEYFSINRATKEFWKKVLWVY
jgi:hypothetical protein